MQVYPQVMNSVIGELGEYGILSGRNSNGHRTNAMVEALLATPSTKFIDAALYNQHSGSDTVQSIVNQYVKQGKLDEVLAFLKSKTDEGRSCDLSEFVDRIVEESSDNFITEFLSLGKDSLRYIEEVVAGLYKFSRRDLADSFIDLYINEKERAILKTINRVLFGDNIAENQILQELEVLFFPDNGEKDRLEMLFGDPIVSRAFGVVNALRDIEYDVMFLKDIYERVKVEAKKRSKFSSGDTDLEQKIRDHLLGKGNYEEALRFVEACGDRYYYKIDVLLRKLVTGDLAKQDAQGTINEITQILDEQIVKQKKESSDEAEEEEDGDFGFNVGGKYNYIDRVNLYEANAAKSSYLVIYELLYGTKEKADEYIADMIEWVDKIRVPGKDNAPIEHQKSLARLSRREKRNIRERFYHLGLLEHLPKNGGWSDAMQDPRIKQERWEKKREESGELSEEKQNKGFLKNKNDYAERTLSYMRLINDNKLDEAKELLKSNTEYGAYSCDWQGAALLLQKCPEAFSELFGICTEALKRSYRSRDKLRGMEWFLSEAIEIGCFKDEKIVEHFCARLLKVCRDPDRGFARVPGSITVNLVSRLIRNGDIKKAWDFFTFFKSEVGKGYSWEVVPRGAEDECMGLFIQAFSEQKEGGISKSFRGDFESLLEGEYIEYYNTEVEMALALGDNDKAQSESESLRSYITSTNDAKEWVRLMNAGTLRNEHTKKDELLAVYASSNDERTRWRMIDVMIDAKIPGVESMPEIQSHNTPIEITRYFLKKLIANEVLHSFTDSFINEDEHIPYLRRLLAEFQNEFNTVMETLNKLSTRDMMSEARVRTEISDLPYLEEVENRYKDPKNWDNILLVLRLVGAFTPGIYAQAQQVGFDKSKLSRIGEDVSAMKERLFTNNPINDEIAPDLMAEIIYTAYKPANISLGDVQRLCRELKDCSHHLEEYKFNELGYKLDFSARKNMRLRHNGDTLDDVNTIRDVLSFFGINLVPEIVGDSTVIQSQARALCEIGRLKITDDMALENVIFPFLEDAYMKSLFVTIGSDENSKYTELRNAQEGFGIYFRDNIEERIKEFFFTNAAHISEMLSSFAQSLKSPKRQRVIKQQLGLDLEEYMDLEDDELAAKIISQAILQKFKPLQEVNRKIKKDISKFVAEDGGEVSTSTNGYRAVFSKNISSFFAKSSAGICTAQDTRLFHREDHFHINIIDNEKSVCVGNIQAYVMEYEGKKHLLLRGFNPSTNLLKEVDPGVFCETIIDICKGFVEENGLEGIMLSEQGGFLALSNRGSIVSYLEKKYRSGEVKIPNFSVASDASISKGYLLAA